MIEQGEQFEQVAKSLFEAGCIKFGEFTLKSGLKSPIYIDLRVLRSFPYQKKEVVNAYLSLLEPLDFHLLADVPTAATPLVSSISDRMCCPQITPRMDEKSHGSGAKIDGTYQEGQTAVLIDDLITTSKSKIEAISVLEANRLRVKDVVVLIDREQGGRAQLAEVGYNLHTYTTMPYLLNFYGKTGLISGTQLETTLTYLGIK